jgi:hypothetical protein
MNIDEIKLETNISIYSGFLMLEFCKLNPIEVFKKIIENNEVKMNSQIYPEHLDILNKIKKINTNLTENVLITIPFDEMNLSILIFKYDWFPHICIFVDSDYDFDEEKSINSFKNLGESLIRMNLKYEIKDSWIELNNDLINIKNKFNDTLSFIQYLFMEKYYSDFKKLENKLKKEN